MTIPPQKFREIVFQILYSIDTGNSEEEGITSLLMKELCVTKKTIQGAFEKARLILAKQAEIDQWIRKVIVSYAFERIQTVERNVLRLGIYELLFDDSIPPKVAIAEAMRLSRKFSTPESSLFVNALIDSIYKLNQGEQIDAAEISQTFETLVKNEEETLKIAQVAPETEPNE